MARKENRVQVPYEEAIQCPWCNVTGHKMSETAAPRVSGVTPGSKIHMFKCDNERCQHNGETYPVQVMPDGSVWKYEHVAADKAYPKLALPSRDQKFVIEAINREVSASLTKGAEIRNPHG